MDTSLAENANQLQKLVARQESPNPSQRYSHEQITQSRCLSDHRQHKGDGCFEKVSDKPVNLIQIEINQHDPNLTHALAKKKQGLEVQEGCPDVEEDADPCRSISDEPERQLPDSERQSNALQRRPILSESTNSECQPNALQRRPILSTSSEHQPLIPQHQPTNPENQPSSQERQATENTEAESPVGNLGASRLAAEHMEPSEDEDEKYRRMMSEELGKQWRDEPEACETTWSLESSLIESGYSEGRSFSSCRKCDLAEDMFLCPESRVFWKKVKGNTCCKRIWKDFFDELKREFPEESALSKKRVLKMFRCLLGVQYQELNEVTIENYLKFIGFFGPFRQEENRCVAVRQLEYLVENSSQQSKNKRSKLCWFAGYLSRQEAEGKLAGQEAGTFIVRMSCSGGMEGSFVISLVMQDKQPEHFQIKGDPEGAVSTHPFSQELEFKGQQFSSLPDLVNNCLRVTTVFDTEDPENGVRCKTICPNLPFNHILDGYRIA